MLKPLDMLDLLNIPFQINGRDKSGIDCLGLAIYFHKEYLGNNLPDPIQGYSTDWHESINIEDHINNCWKEIPSPSEIGDIVLMSPSGKELSTHIGIYINKDIILHTHPHIGSYCSKYSRIKKIINGCYRFIGSPNDNN